MIVQKQKNKESSYEIEAKIGKFVGKNTSAHKQLLNCQNQFSILDKNQINYEFQSKLSAPQQLIANQYIDSNQQCNLIQRVDVVFSNKEQRASLILDQKISNESKIESQSNGQCIFKTFIDFNIASLIQKKKQQNNHIDVMNKEINYRVTMASEKELSNSNKDILIQIASRKKKISLIRAKTILVYYDGNFEISFSSVFQIFQSQTDQFEEIFKIFSQAKHYNLALPIQEIFKKFDQWNQKPSSELEIELHQIPEEIGIEKKLALELIEKTEQLAEKISMPTIIRRRSSQELSNEPGKKVKSNFD